MLRSPFKIISDWLLISTFFITLWLPLADNYFHWDPTLSAKENRNLTPPPEWKWKKKALQKFPLAWEAYYKDYFGWRNSLLWGHNWLLVGGLKQSTSEDIVIGEKGWLYTANDDTLLDYQGLLTLSQEELEFFRQTLEERRDWLKKRNCRFLFIITPDKQSIYPEYLPKYLQNRKEETRADQLIKYLKKNSDLEIIDSRLFLKQAKGLGTLFYLTDTHWNKLGAWVIYQQIANFLRKNFPALPPTDLKQFKIENLPFSGDLSLVLGMSHYFIEKAPQLTPVTSFRAIEIPNPAFRVTKIDDPTLPKALVHRDSFFNALIPFTSELFQTATYIWDYKLNTKIVEKEKPDIVILEMVERMIPRLTPNPSGMRDRPLDQDFSLSTNILFSLNLDAPQKVKNRNLELNPQNIGWWLTPNGPKAQLILPEFAFSSNQATVVSVKITSPIKTKLCLLYKTQTDHKYRTWRQEVCRLQPGVNDCLFYLNHTLISDRLRLDLIEADQPYLLQGLEVRAIPR
ncbi:MAG: hypothetical protein K1X66_04875 [Verrucomicrobiae bacterium]|nr:hypothetical protein [Verrucomicrobiae bacterium]